MYTILNMLLYFLSEVLKRQPGLSGWLVLAEMSARCAGEADQCFGVDGLVEESEGGGADVAVALFVNLSHQHVVQAWMSDIRLE